ncbi:hypothetical protein F5B22DRAFT_658045 [Xylaria bambusicola]|uniref:uncharacterized protein n=1 Tax=Xylaria bambusicola TaxID=326684 RepID=UPI0020084902|nr:uncharacterized protein F5B22DRAFT_658045 [Xylaria bambusicola]KAI0509507.1 hypothetical protein F5B22DRAFT_658045 [Xylaria bambusicola]
MLSMKRLVVSTLVFLIFSLTLATLKLYLPAHSDSFSSSQSRSTEQTATTTATSSLDVSKPVKSSPLPLEYYIEPGGDGTCSRFSPSYLEDFHAHTASYCSPESPAQLICFHRFSGFDGKTDSLCYAQGAVLDAKKGKFYLNCDLRQLSDEEKDNGILPFGRLPSYWYETGPGNIFSAAIGVRASKDGLDIKGEKSGNKEKKSDPQSTPQAVATKSAPSITPPRTILLLKREGDGNTWHCLMEIFSTFMTFDILRILGGVSGDQPPLFRDPGDSQDSQAIVLDHHSDGPYFDLWTLFAKRKPLRLSELLSDQTTVDNLGLVNLIIPLAGSSNPFWKDDTEASQCTNSPNLNVFSHRVLDFYGIKHPSSRGRGGPIIVTWVWRQHRRLKNENTLLAELGRRNSHITVRMVDFAANPFGEQIRIAQETDVLVGVHGAGLTHSMFMRRGAGAVVEIQPEGFEHHGFRNVAGMRNLGYFRTHAKSITVENWTAGETGEAVDSMQYGIRRKAAGDDGHSVTMVERGERLEKRDWHDMDIEIEEGRFFEIVETAIKFMYTKGPWSLDMN